MRLLNNNLLLDATLSATGTDVNYPLSNLKHNFLKKIWRGTSTSETITIEFSENKYIDCVYVGFTNAGAITVKLYNSIDVLLSTQVVSMASGRALFSVVPLVRKATVEITGSEVVFCGTIGIGQSYVMPNPEATLQKNFVDNSTSVSSTDGQFVQNKVEWFRKIEPDFIVDDVDTYNEIYAIFADIDRPIWVDPFEETANIINPMYSRVSFKPGGKKDMVWYFSFTAQEVR